MGLAVALTLVSALSLIAFLVLSTYAPDLRSNLSGGANALSKSAIGFAGIRYLTENCGIETTLGREPAGRDRYSLVILTPGPNNTHSEIANLSGPGARLIILPKWLTMADPDHSGWVVKLDNLEENAIATLLSFDVDGAAVKRGKGISNVRVKARYPRFDLIVPHKPQAIDTIQTVSGKNLEPDIVDGDGNTVLAQIRGTQTYVLADPDFLDNRGIHEAPTARMALRLIELLRVGPRPVSFDLTLNGFRRSPDLLRILFGPPFLGATLCALFAATLIGFHALNRFGPVQRPDRVFAFGKRALADNTAAVIRLMRREPRMAPRYAQAMLNLVAAQVGISRERLADLGWILTLEQRGAAQYRFADLCAEAALARDTGGLLRVATKLYQWRRGILHEHH
jgi:hypothetical protein